MRILILGIVGLSGLGWAVQSVGVHGSTNERAAIRRALRAPFADLKRRDARALCDDFTPSVAAGLASGPAASSCEQRVSALFARARGAGEYVSPGDRPASGRLAVSAIRWRGNNATAPSRAQSDGLAGGSLRLELRALRWRIATPARLEARTDCAGHPVGGPDCVYALSLRFAGD
jgi:hypothetical protein